MSVSVFDVLLVVATWLCSLVAGFLFAFAAVVMPGLRNLDDGAFIEAFQAIDRVIQNNQPLFVVVWVGSVLTLMAAAGLAFGTLSGPDRMLVIVAAVVYLFCVQVPTVMINIPLNNRLQKVDAESMDDAMRRSVRVEFEVRWNRWNGIRTAFAAVVSVLLILLLLSV